jgi:serine protease Do
LLLVTGLVLPGLAGAAEIPDHLRTAVQAAITRMRPALVRIHVVSTEYREGRELKMQAVGSGAIITREGHLVTNHHVAGHAARIVCTLWDREEVDAELVGTDPLTDISVLKLKPEKLRKFEPAVFGTSAKMRVGDSVLAMGSPMALSQSVTLGIISNTEMTMPRFFGPMGQFRLDGEDVGSLVRWIGHDAAIYGGNSGGPLVNLRGEIIGINEIQFGLSGAIPGDLARSIADELIARGKIRRSWLGVDAQPLLKHEQQDKGVLISGVIDDSPAAEAGIKAGDILLRLGKTVTNARYDEQMPDFMRLATSLPIGQDVEGLVWRNGTEIKVRLKPVERGEMHPNQEEFKAWGFTARNISYLVAREMKRTNQAGVLITSVRPGGPSGEAKPSLRPKDVLVEVNEQPVDNIEGLRELTRKIQADKSEPIPVVATFERESRRYLAVVRVGIQELRDPGLEVSKAWLPVETQVISQEIARQLGLPDLKGYYITEVYPQTSAERAGLRPGDFITAVDGEKLTASRPEHEEELAAMIRQYDTGKQVELTLLRDKKPLKVGVELERSPKLQREMKKYRNEEFEFTARDVAFFDVAEERWRPGQRGAIVEDVRSGSWAELGSLNVGDLIVEADGQPVDSVDTLKKKMQQIAGERKPAVVMKVLRGIHHVYLEFEPAWK